MTDYLPLLSRAVAGLERNTSETRRSVYDRARQALLNQLRTMDPPLAESDITRERLALEEAIRRIETQVGKSEAPTRPPPRAPAAPAAGASPSPPAPSSPSSPPSPPAAAPRAAAGKAAYDETSAHETEHPVEVAAVPAKPPRDPYRDTAPDAVPPEAAAEPSVHVTAGDRYSLEGGERFDEPLRPRASPARNVDFAKADARRALKAKLVVSGIVVVVLLVAAAIGFVHRDRILASIGLGEPPARTVAVQPGDTPAADRLPPTSEPETRAPSAAQPKAAPDAPVAAVAQRAVLFEENPGGEEQLQTFVGNAVWTSETVSPGPGSPPELGIRVNVEIPDRKMSVAITIRRNPDTTLPASHTIEVQFTTPGDPFGGVADMPGIRAKTTETAQGVPLAGLVVRVLPGFFLVGLSAIEADREQNLSLLRERGWLDLPFVYNNGRRAVLVIEKGTPGERAVNEAVLAWGG